MTNPLVSVIMPMFNSEQFLKEAIDSVVAQTYKEWELIIVDDCSSDNSVAIVETYLLKYTNITLIKLTINSGAAVARNKAIATSAGKYIAFLDADDLWVPEKLMVQIKFMELHNNALTCSYYSVIDSNGITNKIIKAPESISYKKLLKNNTIGCLTAVYNAEKCGKQLMPLLRKRQDFGLWLNILKLGFTAETIPLVLAKYRVGEQSLSQNKWKVLRYNWELLRKHQHLSFFSSIYYFSCFLFNKTFKFLK